MDETKPPRDLRTRLADVLVRYWRFLLPAALILVAVAFPLARKLELDRSVESLYPPDDPILLDYRRSKRSFGGDEFAVVAFTDPALFNAERNQISEESAARVRELSKRLSEIEGVNPGSTQDLANLTDRARSLAVKKAKVQAKDIPVSFLRRRYVIEAEKTALRRMHLLVEGVLIGEDKETTTVILRLLPEDESSVPRAETIAEIRRIAAEFERKHNLTTAVVGEPIQVHDMFEYVDEDGTTMFYWSLAALSAVILFLFRSLRWVLLPVLIVVATIVWTRALLVLSGMQLSMVSSMMNSLVTIIGVATVMHITVHYREQRQQRERDNALRTTLRNLLPAVFWTCATTAVGFAALLSSEITPVRSFGLMLATATMIVLVAVTAVLPGGALLGRFDADPKFTFAENKLADFLATTATTVRRHPKTVSLATAAVFGFALFGFTRLEVETDFSENFRESSPIVRSLNFVETRLGGAGTWEVNFPAPKDLRNTDPAVQQRNKEYLAKVHKLTETLRERFVNNGNGEVTKIGSLTDGLKMLSAPLFLSLEEQLDGLDELHPEFIPSLYDAEAGRMRIVLRGRERQQSAEKLKVIGQVQQIAEEWADEDLKEQFPAAAPKTTGLYVLLANLIQNLLDDQWKSLFWASLGIVIMMTIAFRSPVIGLLLLLPNTFPIVLVIGGIGWLGIPVNIATAMIASVSIGLTVDFSIHYLHGYRRARDAGMSIDESLRTTLQNVGRALVFSNLALVVGFSVLTVSHFIPLVYFGILVSFAMVGGLIGDLVLLPLILLWTDPERKSGQA